MTSSREVILEETLQKILAMLHDASQIREGFVFADGTVHRNMIYTKPLLDLIGDLVECPDCKHWDAYMKTHVVDDDNDIDWAEIARADVEIKHDMELDRKLRERPNGLTDTGYP